MDTQPVAQALRDVRTALAGALVAPGEPPSPPPIAAALEALDRADAALAVLAGSRGTRADGASTELHALERRVAELTRAVSLHDEFLSTLGHELRNPLSPIFMQAQYLLDAVQQGEPKARTREWLGPQLEGFCRRLQRFLEMLNRIMDVSRMSAGQLTLELEELDLADIVRDIAAGLERELAAARSELSIEAPPSLRGVWDRLRIEQIFTNLLSNAIRYGAGKPIVVTLGGDDREVRLSVRDGGVGISEADQSRIFERFERAGATRSSGGFGIGLWTVQQSCRAMGGHVSVQSRLGDGSEFSVALPRVTKEDERK